MDIIEPASGPTPESTIDEAQRDTLPNAVGGSSGGNLQREIGAEADEIEAVEGRPHPVSDHKSDKPDDGDAPNLPNRQGHVPPRRT
jgi:hypothetical protein